MAQNDFSALKNMIYSGRGITVGMTPSGVAFIGYTLTGRSPPSQARVLVEGENTGVIRTDVTDPEQLKKGSPALLLYPALVRHGNLLIASNGAQTDLIYSAAENAPHLVPTESLAPAPILHLAFERPFFMYDPHNDRRIDLTSYEPDDPNFTPRISAAVRGNYAAFHIVRKAGDMKEPRLQAKKLERGCGYIITTYKGGNESPLLPFEGSLLEMKVGSNDPREIAHDLFAATQHGSKPGEDYSVSAAVMMDKGSGSGHSLDLRAIVNRHQVIRV